ncbi:MAG: zinc ribbon domain-containing protein [Ruminococcus sp.]|nr:zinc ribbon domain-containing protein [Ruminococcus sp.]
MAEKENEKLHYSENKITVDGKTPKDNSFRCSRYESRKSDCTAHYIKESVIDEVVLQSLRKVTAFAREHSEEFYNMAMSNGELEAKEQLKDNENLRSEYEARIAQLENAISTLYMDRVTGRVTPERGPMSIKWTEKRREAK